MRQRLWKLQSVAAPYFFVAPFVLLFCCFLLYPLLRSLWLTFHKTVGPQREVFVGLDNFRFLLSDRLFGIAVFNTFLYAVLFVLLQVPLALGLAIVLNDKRVVGRSVFRFAFFSTHLVGGVFVAILFSQVLSRNGLLNKVLSGMTDPAALVAWVDIGVVLPVIGFALTLGAMQSRLFLREMGDRLRASFVRPLFVLFATIAIALALSWSLKSLGVFSWISQHTSRDVRIDWLGEPYLTIVVLLMAGLWLSVGWAMIYFLAALQSVDRELYEAAEVDGAGPWARFWNVTLPGIKPVLVFMSLVGLIGAFQLFELPWVLYGQTSGPVNSGLTIVMHQFITGMGTRDLGYASAIGWALVLIVTSVAVVQAKVLRRER